MKTFAFALAAGVGALFLSASPAPAQELAPTPRAATPTTGEIVNPRGSYPGPTVIGSGPVMSADVLTAAPTSTRRGLFGRLRNRGTTTSAMPATGPLTTTTPGTIITTPAPGFAPPPPAPVPMPMPMPGTKPGGIAMTTPGVVPASGTIVTTNGTVVTADGTPLMTTSAMTPMTMPPQTRRVGLIGRLRNR